MKTTNYLYLVLMSMLIALAIWMGLREIDPYYPQLVGIVEVLLTGVLATLAPMLLIIEKKTEKSSIEINELKNANSLLKSQLQHSGNYATVLTQDAKIERFKAEIAEHELKSLQATKTAEVNSWKANFQKEKKLYERLKAEHALLTEQVECVNKLIEENPGIINTMLVNNGQ